MNESELILIEIELFSQYVLSRKQYLKLSIEPFALKVGVSKGEISKIINLKKKSVSVHPFYNIVLNSGDTLENARDFVYPHRNLEIITDYKLDKRTNFGLLMKNLFENENTFEIIQAKTGINKQRLLSIYFYTGAPNPYELFLIEAAVGYNTGELMKKYIETYSIKSKR